MKLITIRPLTLIFALTLVRTVSMSVFDADSSKASVSACINQLPVSSNLSVFWAPMMAVQRRESSQAGKRLAAAKSAEASVRDNKFVMILRV